MPRAPPHRPAQADAKRALRSLVNSFALASMRTGAAPRRQRTAPPRRAARTRVRTIGAGQGGLRSREETKIYLVYLLLCFWYTIFSAPEGPRTAEVPRARGSRQPREPMSPHHAT